MTRSHLARFFLGLNAGFSLFTGLACLVAAGSVATALFAAPADWQTAVVRLLGAGLLIFSIDLLLMARDKHVTKVQVHLICLADLGWIAASAGLIVFAGHLFSPLGTTIITVIAGLVAVFATGQLAGARAIVRSPATASVRRDGQAVVATVDRPVAAPVQTVWQVMTDHPAYADVASNLSKVEVIAGQGLGMQRRCYGPKGESWSETCDVYEEGHLFGFKIHTEADDYPYPFAALSGRWSVVPKQEGSEFSIVIRATLKGNWLVRTLFGLVGTRQFRTILIDLADGWAARMESQAEPRQSDYAGMAKREQQGAVLQTQE